MKYTNLGVQLMPLVMAVCSVAFFVYGNMFLMVTCFVMAILMWLVLFADPKK